MLSKLASDTNVTHKLAQRRELGERMSTQEQPTQEIEPMRFNNTSQGEITIVLIEKIEELVAAVNRLEKGEK